jgi:hypothetical protein
MPRLWSLSANICAVTPFFITSTYTILVKTRSGSIQFDPGIFFEKRYFSHPFGGWPCSVIRKEKLKKKKGNGQKVVFAADINGRPPRRLNTGCGRHQCNRHIGFRGIKCIYIGVFYTN